MTERAQDAIRVAVADDDALVTASLATILSAQPDIRVVGQAHDGNQACELFRRERPDVLLLDIRMPGMDGLQAAELILREHPDARIVLLTTFSDDGYIMRALRLGVKGYLIKQEVATIAPALRSVAAGQSVLGGEVLERVDALMGGVHAAGKDASRARHDPDDLASLLSEREMAVVRLVAEGMDNRQIAQRLFIGEGTVRNHISVVLQKLHLKNRTQLAVRYYRGS